jgi:hypothetical protein
MRSGDRFSDYSVQNFMARWADKSFAQDLHQESRYFVLPCVSAGAWSQGMRGAFDMCSSWLFYIAKAYESRMNVESMR